MEKRGVFSEKAINVATFLGGPLSGAYMLFSNFREFGDEEKGKKTLVFGILFFLALFELIIALPEEISDKIPKMLIPLFYSLVSYLVFKKFQEKRFNEYLENGGEKASGWKTAVITVAGMIIIALYLVVRIFTVPYGEEVMEFGEMNHQIYYQKEIPEADVELLGSGLMLAGIFMTNEQQLQFDLKIKDDRYRFLIAVSKQYWQDQDILDSFTGLEKILSSINLSKPIDIYFIDGGLGGFDEISIQEAKKAASVP